MSIVTIERKVLEKNDEHARRNRDIFRLNGNYVINLVSSPGSGKTSLLEAMMKWLCSTVSVAVIEGDVQTDLDARRVAALDIPVVQIVTNGGCHLEAKLVHDAMLTMDLSMTRLLVIENVGNLVCPANYDLGEEHKVVMLSVTEGDDKPLKYPSMFRNASVLIVNKIDLLPYVDSDIDSLKRNALSINPKLLIFEISCRSGEGIARGAIGSFIKFLFIHNYGSDEVPYPYIHTAYHCRCHDCRIRFRDPNSRDINCMTEMIRYHLLICGAVQGIGFRPFLYRLAHEMDLNGWVSNIPQGVTAEIEGEREVLERFVQRIGTDKPALSSIHSSMITEMEPIGFSDFQILKSSGVGRKQTVILPDIATCPDCLSELFDPSNRRFQYPFINCTNCGPRFSIIESLPYDRKNTSMRHFMMCPECENEYRDPLDRRFHAQPNACPVCGPTVRLVTNSGMLLEERDVAVMGAVQAIKKGKILAVKGIGGFHLIADPFSDDVVMKLRTRKHREEKPFALMMPDIGSAQRWCIVSEKEKQALKGTAAPIVLVRRRDDPENRPRLSRLIAPNNPLLGILLPYARLHHIIMNQLNQPLIATSGNRTDEPICIDDQDAIERLGGIADLLLLHDRPIVRHQDDSILRMIGGREAVLRRARGFAPLPVRLDIVPKRSYLAVGAHLKSTIAVNVGASVFVSQHLGDLETEQSRHAFTAAIDDLQAMYDISPSMVVADTHPDYSSTHYAERLPLPVVRIQHHAAHVFSCMAENHLQSDLLGVAWDGTGYGDDGTIWGGEFFSWDTTAMNRIGTFRSFPLPGGAAAVKEPRRVALGLLFDISGGDLSLFRDIPAMTQFAPHELDALCRMMEREINSPRTTSAGRLFDAVSSLTGLRHYSAFEGQTGMELESLLENGTDHGVYPFSFQKKKDDVSVQEIDWHDMILGILSDVRNNGNRSVIVQKFHNTLSEMIVAMARSASHRSVVLSGGCFQNAYLTERTAARLKEEGYVPYWHQRIPPNDGGISLGQLYGAMLLGNNKEEKR